MFVFFLGFWIWILFIIFIFVLVHVMNNAAIRYYSVNLRIVAAMRVILRKLVIEEFWNSCEEEEDKVKSLRWLIHLRIIARKFANNYPIQRFISVNFIRVYSRIWWYNDATYFCRRSNCCRWDQLVDDHPLCHIFLFLFFSQTYVPMNDELIDRICEHWWFSIYQNPRLIIMKRSLFAVDKVFFFLNIHVTCFHEISSIVILQVSDAPF